MSDLLAKLIYAAFSAARNECFRMGSDHCLVYNSDECPVFFSDFYNLLKKEENYNRFIREMNVDRNGDDSNLVSMWCLWYVSYLSSAKHHRLIPHLRDRLIRDFIITLSSISFRDIFIFLLATDKPVLDQMKDLWLSPDQWKRIAEDLLRYASSAGLQFSFREFPPEFRTIQLANLVDYPLKFIKLDPFINQRPLYVALSFRRPDIVRLLLNCGARIPYEDICEYKGSEIHPLKEIILTTREVECSDLNPKEWCVASWRVLLVDLSYTSPLWTSVCEALSEIEPKHEFKERIPTLKHIARARTRSALREARSLWKLDAIEGLGLPVKLINYLYIDEDVPKP